MLQQIKTLWDQYGAKPNRPDFDNAPALSQILSDQAARKIAMPPVGALADYYIRTPIIWPGVYGCSLEGSGGYAFAVGLKNIGATRIIWNGPAGQPIVKYRGCGGRIGRLILAGTDWQHPESGCAGTGIEISGSLEPPAGTLVTDQLAITNCDVGFHFLATPDNDHADQMKHFGLLFHGVKICYWVEGQQSCQHNFYDLDVRNGWETVYKFDSTFECPTGSGQYPCGGAMHVYGCYLGGDLTGNPQTLLYLGQPNYNNGFYEVYGLQVDATVKKLCVLNYGYYVPGCVIRGNAGNNSPCVTARNGDTPFNKPIDIDAYSLKVKPRE